jgi:hypothetical protein
LKQIEKETLAKNIEYLENPVEINSEKYNKKQTEENNVTGWAQYQSGYQQESSGNSMIDKHVFNLNQVKIKKKKTGLGMVVHFCSFSLVILGRQR